MKLHLSLLAGIAFSWGAFAETTTYTGWSLAPDAEAKLAEFTAESAGCRLKNNHTDIIPRAQLKYTLSKDDYIHRWYDRPLYQNTGLAQFNKPDEIINDKEAQAMKAACERAKLWGVAAFPHTSGRISIFKNSLDNQLNLYCELGVRRTPESLKEDIIRVAEKCVNAPNAYRFNGKTVISIYPPELDTGYIRYFRQAFQEKIGDKALLVPYVPFFNKHKFKRSNGPLTAADIEAMAEDLRAHLRIADGILISSPHFIFRERTDNAFGFKVMIPILHKIYAEPEFKDKYLAYAINQGHENHYRWTFIRNSEGVRTLRKELEFVAALRPDVCLLTEWDEVNENTSYRPMANTGWSSLRVVRHFAEKMRGEPFTAFPGDDLSIPNMILAYRRRLLAGETAEYQITNLPDQTPAREYRITLTLTDVKGNVIRSFEPKTLKSSEFGEVSFFAPAAELLSHQLVKPHLEISWDGGKYIAPDSFWAQELRADRNEDWQWAKQPLREQISGIKAEYTVTPYENGLIRLKGTISSPVPMAQAEILEGSDTVWMADKRPALRESDEDAVIQIELHGLAKFNLNVTLDMENAPGALTGMGSKLPKTVSEKPWNSNFSRAYLVRLPKKEVEKAVLHVQVAGCLDEKVPVKEIMEKQVMGFYTPKNGLHMVLTRYNSQFRIPEHFDGKEVSFDFFVLPADVKKSVFSVRVIDPKGNSWRGAEKSLYTPSGKSREFHVYDNASGQGVTVSADENLLTPLTFDFAPGRGTAVLCPAGRKFNAVMNGCTPLVTGVGFGGSRYGSLMFDALLKGKEYPELPRRNQEEDGAWSMEFNNCSYLSLPMQVVPMYAGFKVSMKILVPELSKRNQFIFGSGSHGFMLSVSKGRLRAQMFLAVRYNNGGSGLVHAYSKGKLVPGKWNDVTVVYDQKTFTVYLNGESGEPVEVTGSQMRPKAGILGGGEKRDNFFTGKIKDLSIETL